MIKLCNVTSLTLESSVDVESQCCYRLVTGVIAFFCFGRLYYHLDDTQDQLLNIVQEVLSIEVLFNGKGFEVNDFKRTDMKLMRVFKIFDNISEELCKMVHCTWLESIKREDFYGI